MPDTATATDVSPTPDFQESGRRWVSLDDIGGLEQAWHELERVRQIRSLDPELRSCIERRLDLLDPAVAAPVRRDLDLQHPELVLEVHFRTICPNRPTIGASDA